MMKEYKKPSIKVNKITDEGSMLMSSVNGITGLDNTPGQGGTNDGSHVPGAKRYDVWDYLEDDNEE